MSDLLHVLQTRVADHVPAGAPLCIAFSGGCDSTALLHAATAGLDHPVRALHINHGLHAQATNWAAHCHAIGKRFGVTTEIVAVAVDRRAGDGLEAAARAARYAAFAESLGDGEWLLTAHHRDDQLETVLLRLLRGAGPRGLAGIPDCAPFASGHVLRPWLERRRAELREYATRHDLEWLDDPSNQDAALDRNYLRREIVPLIEDRWPAAAVTTARAAALCAETAELLEALAAQDARRAVQADTVDVPVLRELSAPRQRLLLRYFLDRQGVVPPSQARLTDGLRQLLSKRDDAEPAVKWSAGELRRYRDRLYLLRFDPDEDESDREWSGQGKLSLGPLSGELELEAAAGDGIPQAVVAGGVNVRFRSGGETLRPAGDDHHRSLKSLYQSAGIVPWMRAHVPLLYVDDRLVAVADLWLAAECVASPDEPAFRVKWSPGAALR
ncbi:MAG: tRNA lysidine(34) synthetase TilS [Gammaproteobacteria bacterium]|nr:tRNA lysidine(34) synthetase TilS [Gammaproteobacteria bacterium]